MIDKEKVKKLCDEGICMSMSEARRIVQSGGFDKCMNRLLNPNFKGEERVKECLRIYNDDIIPRVNKEMEIWHKRQSLSFKIKSIISDACCKIGKLFLTISGRLHKKEFEITWIPNDIRKER